VLTHHGESGAVRQVPAPASRRRIVARTPSRVPMLVIPRTVAPARHPGRGRPRGLRTASR